MAERRLKFPRDRFIVNNSNITPVDRYLYIKNLLLDITKNFYQSIRNNDVQTLDILLLYVDPSVSYRDAIYFAIIYKRIDVFNRLLQDRRFDISYRDPIEAAAAGENIYFLDKLLLDPRLNPSITTSSIYGSIDVLNRLLNDPRVDPSYNNNTIISYVSNRGYVNLIDRLLEDPRVNPGAQNNRPIIEAIKKGHNNVIYRLLEDPRVNPDGRPIMSASRYGNIDVAPPAGRPA